MKIDLSKIRNESIHKYIDKPVVLGIRPENIKSQLTDTGSNFHKQKAEVVALEQMGNEILVYTQLGGEQLIARFSPEAKIQVKASSDLHFNLDKVSFFDPETEAVIL